MISFVYSSNTSQNQIISSSSSSTSCSSSSFSFYFAVVTLIRLMIVSSAFSVATPPSPSSSSPSSLLKNVVVVGGTHGNEYTGVWVIQSMERRRQQQKQQQKQQQQQQNTHENDDPWSAERYPSLHISTLLGNPKAHAQNKRFIHLDLNRQFGPSLQQQQQQQQHHNSNTDTDTDLNTSETLYEIQRAREINQLLGPKTAPKTDVIVDLHTTTSNMGATIIVAEGDTCMTQAAAYIMGICAQTQTLNSNDNTNNNDNNSNPQLQVRCLMHRAAADADDNNDNRMKRINLCSIAKHGFTIEIGPTPTGVIRHDVVQQMEHILQIFLEYLQLRNQYYSSKNNDNDNNDNNNNNNNNNIEESFVREKILPFYPSGRVPCFCSARAQHKGEMSGKIRWPTNAEEETTTTTTTTTTTKSSPSFIPPNPNFPRWIVHREIQDQDFVRPVHTGDPLFVDAYGNTIPYTGSHGSPVHLMFVNEAGYYYEQSGTGISVANPTYFNIWTGKKEQGEHEHEHEHEKEDEE